MPSGGKRPGAGKPRRVTADMDCELLLDKLARGGRITEEEHRQLVRYASRKRKRAYDARRRGADNGQE